jgi:hypothetical protein
MTKLIINLIFGLLLLIGVGVQIMKKSKARNRVETDASYEVFYASDLRAMAVCENFELDSSAPNSKELYKSYEYQFELYLPINEAWSTEAHRLSLFENSWLNDPSVLHSLEFGPVVNTKSLKCQRTHELLVINRRDFETVWSSLNHNDQKVSKQNINNEIKSILIKQGDCHQDYLELFGPKYNVILMSSCHSMVGFPELLEIVSEFKFYETNQ